MTKEEVEGNKIIAEFMGAVYLHQYEKYEMRYMKDAPHYSSDGLEYRSSWDWLIPVVEKIARDYDVKITWMPTALNVTYIERPDVYEGEITSMGGMTAIENTWHSVVKFIEWYNKNRKKHYKP